MKQLAVSIGLVFTLASLAPPCRADGSAVTFTPGGIKGGTLDGQVPVSKVGDLVLQDARAVIKGNVIDVESKDPKTGAVETVLSGVVFSTKVSGTGDKAKVTGSAYFRQGSSITALNDVDCEELIDIEDGGLVAGKIIAVNREELVMRTAAGDRHIPVEKIKRICSPRVFTFSMPFVADS